MNEGVVYRVWQVSGRMWVGKETRDRAEANQLCEKAARENGRTHEVWMVKRAKLGVCTLERRAIWMD